MKGDFSRWDTINEPNLNGVLHQQGRVLLDRDWNDQTQITLDWQKLAAKQIIGADVAAISAEEPHALKVTHAKVDGDEVKLEIHPGQAWVNGLAVILPNDSTVIRTATYLDPPLQDPSGKVSDLEEQKGVRDAVVLEVWQEALNGFQQRDTSPDISTDTLIEPALGGPDTTERVLTSMRFRLFRLAPDEDCHNLTDKLQDDISKKGKLKVSLEPTTETDGDCPVVKDGGYTGFEHNFYRIEIAQVNGDVPKFKWSQFNGGLVGRGKCDLGGADKRITLKANDQGIKMSGLTDFYLEVVEFEAEQGFWRVTYGAEVTLDGDDLNVTAEHYIEPNRPSGKIFFRLWNGIYAIANFPKAIASTEPNQLRDGIRLEFDAPNPTNYRPGDYWTFKVRAGEIPNKDPIFDRDVPPQGIEYYRVPLAELNWDADRNISFDERQIEDCRDVFPPLTKQKGCCTFTVGDGKNSQGDFNSIEEAIEAIHKLPPPVDGKIDPPVGGKICVLPGIHTANVDIINRDNIHITGCGVHSIVLPRTTETTTSEPIFRIAFSRNIQIDHLTLVTFAGTGIQVLDDPILLPEDNSQVTPQDSTGIHILWNHIIASIHGIEIRTRNETQAGNNDIWIAHNQIYLLDKPIGEAAILSIADGVLIERNRLLVVPPPQENDPQDPRQPDDPSVSVFNPCTPLNFYYSPQFPIYRFLQSLFLYGVKAFVVQKPLYVAQVGIQIGGSSDGVKIIRNEIIGGWGNGITLGHLPEGIFDENTPKDEWSFVAQLSSNPLESLQAEFVSFLYSIAIEDNTIWRMGLSGIGVVSFFKLETIQLMVQVENLTIYRNQITECAQQLPIGISDTMFGQVGFGGISLTGCESATIQENRIENNGISYLEPICGVFILFGDKIEISNNHILNNGKLVPKTQKERPRRGLRGGIFISLSWASRARELLREITEVAQTRLPFDDGVPAVKVNGNVVTQPLGQALFVIAIGPVSVVDNQFTSQDIDAQADFFTFIAGAVFILNLGFTIQEIFGLGLLKAIQFGKAKHSPYLVATATTNGFALQPGVLNAVIYGTFWPSGKVLFNDNQTTLDLRAIEPDLLFSSQFIFTLDDIGFSSNQSDCNTLVDVLVTNTFLMGFSIRSNDNRFREGLIFTLLSLFSFGILNTNTYNQGSHCFLALASSAQLRVDRDNIVLFDQFCKFIVELLTERYG